MSRAGGLPTSVYKSGTAVVAQLPTSTTIGGNARGTNAVDLQSLRTVATQVASGTNSVIGGGENNTSSNTRTTVAGGSTNSATAIGASVGGGFTNTASGGSSTIAGGSTNTASGTNSWVPGGTQATTRGVQGSGAWSAGRITATGDTEVMMFHLGAQTVDATATRVTAGNGVASASNTINLPNFAVYAGRLTVTGKATGSTAVATWNVEVSALRDSTAASVVVFQGVSAALAPTASNGTGSAWRLDIAADTTNGGIAVTVTGAVATTINWSAFYIGPQATTAS